MRHITTRERKARAEELAEGYQDARDEEFSRQFIDFITTETKTQVGFGMRTKKILTNSVTEDDIQGFMDSFTFPDEDTWSCDAVDSELDDIGDQAMELEKDRKMGL